MLATEPSCPFSCAQPLARRILRLVNVLLLILLFSVVLGACAPPVDLGPVRSELRSSQTQLANVNASIDTVRREIATVRGDLEATRHRVDRIAQDRYTAPAGTRALEERIVALERRLAPPPRREPYSPSLTPLPGELAPPQPPQPLPIDPTDPNAPPLDPRAMQEQQEYAMALQLLREQQYDKAVEQLRSFQRVYPTSEMADDAQYWVGESYFLQNDFNRAILEFNDVLKYRRGDKRPDALVRQAEAFLEIGDKTDARLILRKVSTDYPQSDAARKARDLLRTLE